MREVTTNKPLTAIYQESQRQLEEVQHWKSGMFDRVREESLRRVSQLREGYMIDEMETEFRGLAKRLVEQKYADVVIHSYVFTPKGLEIKYQQSWLTDSNYQVEYTYQQLQEKLDEEAIQNKLIELVSTEESGSPERLQQSEHSQGQEEMFSA